MGKKRGKKKQKYNVFDNKEMRFFKNVYPVLAVLMGLCIIFILMITVFNMPGLGVAENPDNNEVSKRYIEQGLTETGATNIVSGMILDYRAFDTFGESCVLFIAASCVFVMLKNEPDKDGKNQEAESNDRVYEPKNDMILQASAKILVPIIFVFGIYVILNGHLSPGGGFSGGAILGAALILYLNAFGFKKTENFFVEKTFRKITVICLSFYCLAKSYSFYTGANHLESHIPKGTPGAILSSGLILPLNICVGLIVTCTMYAFYCMFRKGDF